MTTLRTSALRILALSLMCIVALASAGRGFAPEATGSAFDLPGVAVPICHAAGRDTPRPTAPVHHECCDACALSAAAMLTGGAGLIAPATIVHRTMQARTAPGAPILARARTPRQSQGPPDA